MNISIKDMNESGRGEMGSARGEYIQYVDGREEIVLNSRNSRTQNLTTSIHELAHKSFTIRMNTVLPTQHRLKSFKRK